MSNNPGDQEFSDTVALWGDLRKYLKTKMEVGEPEIRTPSSGQREYKTCKVKVTVANIAPDDPDWPVIVFMGVGLGVMDLRIGGLSNQPHWLRELKREKTEGDRGLQPRYSRVVGSDFPRITSDEQQHGDVLFPGESVTYQMDVPSEDIPHFELCVEATVSRRHLFHYQQVLPMPTMYTRPPLLDALRAFNAIELHETLYALVKSMPDFGPDTRLADIRAFSDSISGDVPEKIKKTQQALSDVYHLKGSDWRIRAHINNNVAKYLRRVSDTCQHMQTAISSSNPEEMVSVAGDIKALQIEATQVNRATEKLMHSYGVSDEEANYRYRGR